MQKNNRAFMIFEVALAAAVLMGAVAAMLYALGNATESVELSRQIVQASARVDEALDDVRHAAVAVRDKGSVTLAVGEDERLRHGHIEIAVAPGPSEELALVTVTLRWDAAKNFPRQFTARTLVRRSRLKLVKEEER